MMEKYGEPKRVAYDMRMESIIEEVKDQPEHLVLKSHSSESED